MSMKKIAKRTQSRRQESWRNWHGEMLSDTAVAARFGQVAHVGWRSCLRRLQDVSGSRALVKACAAPHGA
jgi:hypothetical protein